MLSRVQQLVHLIGIMMDLFHPALFQPKPLTYSKGWLYVVLLVTF